MLFNYEKNFIFWQLLLYGIHIGHRFRNSSLYAGWLIFTYTYETLIINLYKTILGFKNGNVGYDYCCKVGAPVWFLNLNKAFEIYVNESALKCGEFAYTTYWIHGMISNWLFLADQIDQLWHYTEDAHKGQFAKLEMDYSPWFMSRWSWPRALLISSVHTSVWPSHECLIAKIPSVGIVDTNISGHISNIATPGNDDSLDAMVYYNTNTSQYILEKKYMHVTAWLHHIRELKRNISFSDWVLRYFIKKNARFNKSKLFHIIDTREKKNKVTDPMKALITYKINIVKYWGLGVKFFFGLDSGKTEFQAGLDLYGQNGEKINDRFDVYSLMEKFKQKAFFICKLLNFYLLKALWHTSSSTLVRRKFMSQKWFKYRFLTTNYYAQVWWDDYFRTNFLVNRFWRNRIFKTYLRRSFFRNNNFLVKFFKFYNIYRYNIKRGFMDSFSASYMKVSAFSSVAFSYGFNYFKRHFYTPLLGHSFKNLFNNKKITFLSKWLFFKKEIGSFVNKIVYANNNTQNLKFAHMYKVYAFLKNKIKDYYYNIYSYLNFYYSFWYWNRGEYRFIKMTKRWNLTKKFRSLKNLNKLHFYLDLYSKSVFPFKRFQSWYLKKNIDHQSLDLFEFGFSRVFSLLGLNYRKNYFDYFLNHRLYKINRWRRYFKKLVKIHREQKKRNNVIYQLQFKYKRFKKTREVKKAVRKLYRKLTKNVLINFFNKKYNKLYTSKMSIEQFLPLVAKKNFKLKRLARYNSIRYEVPGFNFFQATKKFYNKDILVEWSPPITIKNEISWDLEDDDDKTLPSLFLKIYSKSKNPTHGNVLTHNLSYFSQVIIKTTFKNIFAQYDKLHNSKLFKFVSSLKKEHLYYYMHKYKLFNKNVYSTLRKLRHIKNIYKRHVLRAGSHNYRYVSGLKFFNYFTFLRLWSLIKKDYFLNEGFSFKIWKIGFNINYPRSKKDPRSPVYLEKKNSKNFNINYTYFFYLRYFTIFNRYLSLLKHKEFGPRSPLLLRKNRVATYFQETKKTYWS